MVPLSLDLTSALPEIQRATFRDVTTYKLVTITRKIGNISGPRRDLNIGLHFAYGGPPGPAILETRDRVCCRE